MNSKLIKIEPNPFRSGRKKFKMRTPKMQNGVPILNSEGKAIMTFQDAQNITRIPGTSTTLAPGLLPNGRIATGLDIQVKNPYKEEKVYTQEWGERILKGKDKALLQHILEYKHGVAYDYYTSRIDTDVKKSNSEQVYYEKGESKLIMKDNTAFLDLNNPNDELKYYMLKAHPSIANSYAELEDGGNLDAEWYMVDEFEKDQIKVSRIEREVIAGAALKQIMDAGEEISIQFCKALELDEASNQSITKEAAQRAIYEYYNNNEDTYNRFIELFEMWKEPVNRSFVIAAAELYDWIKAGLINYRNGKYSWISPAKEGRSSETFMHPSKRAFIDNFMLDPNHQEEVEMIRNIYESKNR